MKFSDRTEEETGINMTPLIDVVFLLLIFFMVSTTFSKESQLKIKLPESSDKAQEEQVANILEIEISAEGAYAVRGPGEKDAKPVLNTTRATLRRALLSAVGARKDLVTVIRADRKTPHQSVIQAMDMARQLGYTHITFATQRALDDADKQ